MAISTSRRAFLKMTATAATVLSLGRLGHRADADELLPLSRNASSAKKLGWRLGAQAYAFRKFSLFEAIDKNASLGLSCIEAYPGQRLSKEKPDVMMNVDLTPALRAEVKSRLNDAGVKLVNFGVCNLTKEESEARKTFDFAKEMGVETLVSEPLPDAFDTLEKLCDEYGVNLAVHNHPKPSRYWDYRTVLEVCKNRSKRIGACCDTGHWMRSGIDPLEALRALEGRLVSFHLKDLNKFGVRSAHDVPWGTGVGNLEAVLAEVHRQKFQGFFAMEYEHDTPELVANMAKCVEYFDRMAEKLAAAKPA